jgi:hypothetical protein
VNSVRPESITPFADHYRERIFAVERSVDGFRYTVRSLSEKWIQVASDASEYASKNAEKRNVAAATFLTKLATVQRFNALHDLALAEQGMAYALKGAPTTRIQTIQTAEGNLAIAKENLEKARIASLMEVPVDLGTFLAGYPDVRTMVEEQRRVAAAAAPAAPVAPAAPAAAAPAAAAASGGVFSYVKSFFGRRGPTSRRTRSSRQTRRNH